MLSKALHKTSLLTKNFVALRSFSTYTNLYEEHVARASSEATIEEFWREQAKMIDWYKEPEVILDKSNPPFFRWFKGGLMNTSYNSLDRHVNNGLGNQNALIYESPVTNFSATYTYSDLLDKVSRFANVLEKQGVTKGDRVLIYMPVIPEAIVAMQACARIGAVHSVVFGGFAGPELASRIKDAQPKVIVSASCGIEPNKIVDYKTMLDDAVRIAGRPDIKRIILQRDAHRVNLKKGLDFEFYDELANAKSTEAVPVDATHPLYIIYTSGTTGTPKGVVRDHGGNAVALSYAMKHILNVGKGEVYFMATDIGWATGHSYIAYGPLLTGSTGITFEGKPIGTPDAGIIWRICEKYKVKGLFSSPTALRTLRREDPEGEHIKKADLSNLRTILIGGERLDVPAYKWISSHVPKTCLVADNYWQTETGWQVSSNFANLHTFTPKPGSAGKPVPGSIVRILDDEGRPVPPRKIGAVCLKYPTAPSFVSTLHNNDKGFVSKYFSQYPGHYFTGDAGYLDEEGYLHIVSRLDDIINTAGHRLSTSQMEEVLLGHKDIVEAAVIGALDDIKGEIPVGFVVLKAGVNRNSQELEKECIQKVRTEIGPVACFKFCMVVDKLPKTRSGKIVRKVLRNIANGEKPEIPPTIEDATVVETIKQQVEAHGLGKTVEIKYEELYSNPERVSATM